MLLSVVDLFYLVTWKIAINSLKINIFYLQILLYIQYLYTNVCSKF